MNMMRNITKYSKTPDFKWSEIDDKFLIEQINIGRTYSEIGRDLRINRSMVAGRIFRLRKIGMKGIAPANKPSNIGLSDRYISGKRSLSLNTRKHKAGPIHLVKSSEARKKTSLPAPTNEPTEFYLMERGQCYFPTDDELPSAYMKCCGAKVSNPEDHGKQGSRLSGSFCDYHVDIATRSTRVKNEDAPKRGYR